MKKNSSVDVERDFKLEMSRLEKMVDILSTFVTAENIQLFSHDINEIVLQRLEQHQKNAKNIGVRFEVKLDDVGCPSQVNTETIGWILDQIIINALEVSSKDRMIQVRSKRHSNYCRVEIKDEGPGIKTEHLPSIFKPFFTTKKMGQDLALASCRKSLLDMGGDIEVESEYGNGATFALIIPREYSGKPLAADPIATIVKGEMVRGVYRE